MGAIGNYVHYSAQGYLLHGVTIKGRYAAYTSQKEKIKSKVASNSASSLNKKERKELEDVLQSMMTTVPSNNNQSIAKAQQEVLKKMQELFGEALGEIDWLSGNISFQGNANLMMGQAHSSLDVDDMVRRMDQLDKILEQKAKEGMVGTSEIKKSLKTMKKEYQNMVTQIQNDKKNKGLDPTLTTFDASKSLGKFRKDLNKLIKEHAAYPAIPLQKGTFFEHLISYAPMVAQQEATQQVGKVIGDVTENVSLNLDKFANSLLTKEFKQMTETTRVSQGKIDVEMNWQGKDIKISAKNVNLGNKYIQLLTNSSLLYLLQDEDSNFVNHALNILSSHSGNSKDKGSIKSMRPAMIEELRLIILYKALTGDVNKRKTANLFIVNDNRFGIIRVHNIEDIILKAIDNLNTGVAVKGVNQSMSLFKNPFSTSAPARISALLADVHSRKISVGIKTSML